MTTGLLRAGAADVRVQQRRHRVGLLMRARTLPMMPSCGHGGAWLAGFDTGGLYWFGRDGETAI